MKKYSCIWGIDPAIMGIETKTVSREHKFEKILNSGLENYSAKNILKRLNGIDFENILSWVILKTWNENFFENSQSFMAADWQLKAQVSFSYQNLYVVCCWRFHCCKLFTFHLLKNDWADTWWRATPSLKGR